jgi:aspartate/methionine/tyrosine aminotransferase
MQLQPFLLDQWIERKFSPDWQITHDLSSSAGPPWTVRELLELDSRDCLDEILSSPAVYSSVAGSPELRRAIAEFEGVSEDDIQIVTGAQEGLLAVFMIAAEPGTNVVLPHPGYPVFDAMPRAFGVEIRQYRLRPENQFRIDVEEAMQLTDARTTVLLVNSPHNPTGAVLSDPDKRDLHDFCAKRGIQFVCDQVFHPIFHGEDQHSAAALPEATVLGDLSKAMCLSGLRIGWIVERDARRMARYRDARSYFTITNSPITEALAAIAVRHRDAVYARARQAAAENLRRFEARWAELRNLFEWVRPQGAFTIFPWLRDGSDARPLCERLATRGVLVVPGDCFTMPAHVRIGFGDRPDRFATSLDRLSDELAVVHEHMPEPSTAP